MSYTKTKYTKTKYTKKSNTFKTKKNTNYQKYCCLDRKNKKECTNIYTTLQLKENKNPKYAIASLLFGSDSYLPGVLLLGSSIRHFIPKAYEKYFTLCCMVTPDINKSTRDIILKIYDKVIEVDYLQIPPHLIKHKDSTIRTIYSKAFTKLRIFEMVEYDKVLFLDADMLVLKKDIFSLFNLNTPAVVFMGKISNNPDDRYYKDFKNLKKGNHFKNFQNKYCHLKGKELHGNLIPYDKFENETTSNGMNIETSILLIKPSKFMGTEINNYLANIKAKQQKISGDTELISRMFKEKLYAIEPRFFGRWVDPKEMQELVVLDLYGIHKPWDMNNLKDLLKYIEIGDISYWWDMFLKYYKSTYKMYENKLLDSLYEKLKNKNKNNFIDIFTLIYETNEWGDNNNPSYEGSSGWGSSIEYNKNNYIPFIRSFIEKFKIKTIVDLGCGDFRIGKLLYQDLDIDFTGYDAYEGVINFNKDKYKEHKNFHFIHSDFSAKEYRGDLKEADLCIIKDVLQHWPNNHIIEFMEYITNSKKYKYILIINCWNNTPHNTAEYRKDIKIGELSAVSAARYPLNKFGGKIIYRWDQKEISLITL
jgi:alpha-N-acetylglucosamine transferase